ncbi:MAG: molybdopterin-guanine dinucleotide biosynthesis protein MobB [Hyphomicrobiales bacterium]|nr:molybdopterin-guanine dinucleotide biosynthesis protein MobB [Hyphomicrobiales bacterium]
MKLIGLAGWSGAGKTTLLTRVIPLLTARGLRVSTIKHAHHKFDVDTPGKDSHAHREAGATEVLVSSGRRFALMHELRDEPEWPLRELLAKITPVNLVIVEGFKADAHPKIEVHRTANGKPFLHAQDSAIVALVTDADAATDIPVFALDDIAAIADMMLARAVAVHDLIATDSAEA